MAVQWCTFVQFTKNHVQSENLHLRLDILHRLVFFSRTHPRIMGSFSRIGIHPDQNSPFNCCLGEWVFLVLEIAFFVDPKNASGAKKHWNAGFLTVQGKEWPDRFVPSISKISWFVMPCLGGKMAPVAGMRLWVRSKSYTSCWLHKMSYNNPQYIL